MEKKRLEMFNLTLTYKREPPRSLRGHLCTSLQQLYARQLLSCACRGCSRTCSRTTSSSRTCASSQAREVGRTLQLCGHRPQLNWWRHVNLSSALCNRLLDLTQITSVLMRSRFESGLIHEAVYSLVFRPESSRTCCKRRADHGYDLADCSHA